MRIQILGTAAAEGWPALFCGCGACRRARSLGGRDIRSSIQIDQICKVDLPPDSFYHSIRFGIDLSKLEHLFISHSHGDHFAIDQLEYLAEPFAHDRSRLMIYAGSEVLRRLQALGLDEQKLDATFWSVRPFECVVAGHLRVTPIRAIHMPDEECFNYVFDSDEASLLYAADTGWYPDETWAYLESRRLDCVIMEATNGPRPGRKYHMNLEAALEAKERLQRSGTLSSGGRFVLTHVSHNGGLSHAELEAVVRPWGAEMAYDGMEIEI